MIPRTWEKSARYLRNILRFLTAAHNNLNFLFSAQLLQTDISHIFFFFFFPNAATRCSPQDPEACCQSLRHHHPESCPPSSGCDCRDTAKDRLRWNPLWFNSGSNNARRAKKNGGRDRGRPLRRLLGLQRVSEWSSSWDPWRGDCSHC